MGSAILRQVPELLPLSIQERQNCRRSLNRLAAQRCLYRRSKGVENWRLVSVALAMSLLMLDFAFGANWFSHLATVIVVLSWSTEQALLVRLSTRMKEEASTIQEDFDCFVLKIPWAAHRSLDRPTEDRIRELSSRAARIATVKGNLMDWYGRDGIPAEPIEARVHCQRANCRWDERLRKEWIRSVSTLLALVLACIVVVAAFTGVSIMESVLLVAATLRVLTWLVVEFREQSAAKKRICRLHRYLSGKGRDGQMSMCDVRLVQDTIFEHRRTCPTVPDWFYGFRRAAHERLERC